MVKLRDQSLEIKTGLRKSFEVPNSKVANRICYGYSKLNNGELIINEWKPQLFASFLTATIKVIV